MKKKRSISLANTPHLWDVLLKKLSTFVENRPSENALLCKILLQLLRIPKPANERMKKFMSKQKQEEMFQQQLPLEVLQWWLFITEFDQRVETHLSEEEQEKIKTFNEGMEKLRRKMNIVNAALPRRSFKASTVGPSSYCASPSPA